MVDWLGMMPQEATGVRMKVMAPRVDPPADPNADSALRILVLMRHAEAGGGSTEGDMARELTLTGRQAAREVGSWLLNQGVRPDVVVLSPSVRTRQTWTELSAAGLPAGEVFSDRAIYDGHPEHISESIRAVPDDARTVMVIGHAPGIPSLTAALPSHLSQGAEGPERGWPPAAVVVVGHRGAWSQFPDTDTAVVAFRRP